MTLVIPDWALWLAFAFWPWPVAVVVGALEDQGTWFDVPIWTLLAYVFAFGWTIAVIASRLASWLI